jgi:hypothetical protein
MRVWHNFYPVGDIVEYVPKRMYGVVEYEGEPVLGNHKWLATMLSYEDVIAYVNWCDFECDRIIWNAFTRKPGQKEWLPGDENKEEE